MNSPHNYSDPTDNWALIDDAIALGGGFVGGVTGQAVPPGKWCSTS